MDTIRFLYDSENITDEFINKVKSYFLGSGNYGISQNPDTKDYVLVFNKESFESHCCKKCGDIYKYNHLDYKDYSQYCKDNEYKWCKSCHINHLKNNYTNWASGNEKIDNFIQQRRLNIKTSFDLIFEWIPFNEFIEIKEIRKDGFSVAIWKEGPLRYDIIEKEWMKESYKKVALKYLSNLQNITDEFLKEVTVLYDSYGISQNPNTKDYILVIHHEYYKKYCVKCDKEYIKPDHNCNESSNVFEWIPYNEFIDIKEIGYTTAIWKEGPLYFDINKMRWMRTTYGKVCLKYLSQEDTDEFINKGESVLTNEICYGVSQNPVTKDYILVFKNDYFDDYCEKCGNKYENTSCNNREDGLAISIWTDGPLYYNYLNRKYKRKLNKKVILKYLSNSQNINNEFLSEINYLIEKGYGISQDPNTKDYILILQLKYYCEKCGKEYDNEFEINTKSCMLCQISHENKKINDLIQEMKLNIDHKASNSIIFEWIPYDQFDDIKEIVGDWEREPNKKVALKCLHNSQNFLDEFINKVKAYPNQKINNILKIYGISQNPDTKDYIMVLEVLKDVFNGLSKIHQKQMIHRDLHIGNVLFTKIHDDKYRYLGSDSIFYIEFLRMLDHKYEVRDSACVSDMELCRRIDDINETNIYGVIPYVAPEILKGKPYTQAADIYSFGMIMCWDLSPDNRPNSLEINEIIELFYNSLDQEFKKEQQHYEIEKQFKETQEYRKENFLTLNNNKSTIHAQAVYTSRLLNPFTKKLS
ncbi:kinase-like domain-containing protein [Rhizophagus clarus]|uniref:Kinase-like domain-containing protein n=1 Tax=Rhizophagus clarus TaxID=94130 RepID=A0A8H3M280_9GLOM|nr:kinase-like domain-containing protein [Rhizophagus clarus]